MGNLAIIPQYLNASIRDATWTVKKKGKGANKPGLELCAGGLHTLHNVLEKDEWNEKEIESRASWLCDHAKSVWVL